LEMRTFVPIRGLAVRGFFLPVPAALLFFCELNGGEQGLAGGSLLWDWSSFGDAQGTSFFFPRTEAFLVICTEGTAASEKAFFSSHAQCPLFFFFLRSLARSSSTSHGIGESFRSEKASPFFQDFLVAIIFFLCCNVYLCNFERAFSTVPSRVAFLAFECLFFFVHGGFFFFFFF